jgi:hypothetical protein
MLVVRRTGALINSHRAVTRRMISQPVNDLALTNRAGKAIPEVRDVEIVKTTTTTNVNNFLLLSAFCTMTFQQPSSCFFVRYALACRDIG